MPEHFPKFYHDSITGPYQCELCQCITESKEEFVSHIKTKHLEDVDDEVLNILYSDLRKARRKMELAQIQNKQHVGNENVNGMSES